MSKMYKKRRSNSNHSNYIQSLKLELEQLKKQDELVVALLKLLKEQQQQLKAEETVFRMCQVKEQGEEVPMQDQGGIVPVQNQGGIVPVQGQAEIIPLQDQGTTATVEDDPMMPLFDPRIHYVDFEINEIEKYL